MKKIIYILLIPFLVNCSHKKEIAIKSSDKVNSKDNIILSEADQNNLYVTKDDKKLQTQLIKNYSEQFRIEPAPNIHQENFKEYENYKEYENNAYALNEIDRIRKIPGNEAISYKKARQLYLLNKVHSNKSMTVVNFFDPVNSFKYKKRIENIYKVLAYQQEELGEKTRKKRCMNQHTPL